MWGLRSWIRSLKSKSSKAQFLVSILKTTHINCLDNTHFLQKIDIILAKHINTARLTFPWYSLQCDLYSCGVLLQRLSLACSFLLVDTSERCCSHISTSPSVKSVSFASAIFSSPGRLQPFLSRFFSRCLSNDYRWGLNLYPLSSMGLVEVVMLFRAEMIIKDDHQ